MTADTDIWQTESWLRQARILRESHLQFLGRPLLPSSGDEFADAEQLFRAPFVVVSHGVQADPILNYGNAVALDLWEMDSKQFTSTPSRKTAEPDQRDERARMLRQADEQGYFDNYRGVRISSRGRRFEIERATIWRLLDGDRNVGLAATFSNWRFLDET